MLTRRCVLGGSVASVVLSQSRNSSMFADAEAYERFMGRWSRLLAPALVNFAAVPDTGAVLDVGSGTGSLAFAVAGMRAHCRVLGIDPSEEYVAFARGRNRWPERVSFEQGDAQRLRLHDASFDAAVSLLVFNFIPDSGRALGEVKRVTKPGGAVSLAVWDYGGGMRMLRLFWDAAKSLDTAAEPLDESHMRLCREGELAALCRAGGLQRVEERPLEITMRFASLADYWDPFLAGQGPAGAYVRHRDEAARRKLRDEVKRRLGVRAEDEPFSLPARAWAVRAIVPGR